jgi:hypothetical protein
MAGGFGWKRRRRCDWIGREIAAARFDREGAISVYCWVDVGAIGAGLQFLSDDIVGLGPVGRLRDDEEKRT